MALNLANLQADIEALAENPGDTIAACAQQWAEAVGSYASGVVPASTTVATAQTALQAALTAAFATPAAAAAMELAFTAFATTVALGMVGAGFTGVPPPGPVGFAAQFAGAKPTTHAQAGQQLGTLIDAWMRTGTAVLIAPPNTPVTWT